MPVSTIPLFTTDEVRSFLLGLPGVVPERVEEGLRHPHGIRYDVPDYGPIAFIRVDKDHYEFIEHLVENPDRVKTAITKELRMPKSPELLIGQAIVYPATDPNTEPRKPQGEKGLIDEILAKRGEYLVRPSADPEERIRKWTKEAFLRHPQARFASESARPVDRYSDRSEPMRVAAALEVEPTISVATGAKAVPARQPLGTIDRSTIRADRAASESQAQEVMDRVRAKQASDPTLKASAQRSDGSFYGPDGAPHENLSMTRRPADRDSHPGLDSYPLPKDLSGVEKSLVKGIEARTCAVEGCNTRFASASRRFCSEHAHNRGGKLGLKGEK